MISRQQRLRKRRRRTRLTFFSFVLVALLGFGLYQYASRDLGSVGQHSPGAAFGMELEAGQLPGSPLRGEISAPLTEETKQETKEEEAFGAENLQGQEEASVKTAEDRLLAGTEKETQPLEEQEKERVSDAGAAGAGEVTHSPETAASDGSGTSEAEAVGGEEEWRETFYPVPAAPPVDDSYFSDAVFIGDSRVQGLMIYSGLTQGTFYAEKSMTVQSILDTDFVSQGSGPKITVREALEKNKFKKVYIKLGINELGSSLDWIAREYGRLIDEIQTLQPDAILYVQSVIPVSKHKQETSKVFTNPRIQELNDRLKKLTWEKGIYYLDIYEGLIDEEGFLPKEASSDGIHLNRTYCKKWLEYLKNHTVQTGVIDL